MQSRNIRPTGRPGQQGGFPAPKSRRDDDYDDDHRGGSRGGKDDQYSSSRSGRAPPPSDHSSSRQGPSASAGRSRGPVNSTSSESSTGSSLLDRMKVRSDTSARTSLDEDEGYRGSRNQSAKKPTPQSLRRPSRTQREREYEEDEEEPPPPDPNSAGNSLWSRLTTAAGNLSVTVGKAWEGGNDSGEETPVDGESRLTKAMKEYYLSRANRPSDLPPWLFEEHERGGGSSRATRGNTTRGGRRDKDDGYDEDERRDERRGARPKDDPQPQATRGFRDIYDRNKGATNTASSSSSRSRLAAPTSSRDGGISDSGGGGPTKSTSRLAAIREAKRTGGDGGARRARSDNGDDDYRNDYEEPAPARRPPPRAGLPSGPGGRARRV